MTGREAYQEFGEQGFLQNPYLVGSHHDACKAAAWWNEFDSERRESRVRARSGQRRKKSPDPAFALDFYNARVEQLAQIRGIKPRTKDRE